MPTPEQHDFVVTMGIIGAGKTTAAELVQREMGFRIFKEQFGKNPYLDRFYQDMPRWAFHSQMNFLLAEVELMRQVDVVRRQSPVVKDSTIQQYAWSFARAQFELGHMGEAEWEMYLKIFELAQLQFSSPDLIVYIDAKVATAQARIKGRDRTYEGNIPDEYLETLKRLNNEWIARNNAFPDGTRVPVVIFESDGRDIRESGAIQREFLNLVQSALQR